MKRPLAVVGFTMLVVLNLLCNFEGSIAFSAVGFAALLCLFVCLIVPSFRHTVILPTVFGSALAACLLVFVFNCFCVYPAVEGCCDNGEIVAVVSEYPSLNSGGDRYYVTSRLVSVNGEKAKGRVRLSFPAKPREYNDYLPLHETKLLSPGDALHFKGKLYPIGQASDEIQLHFKSDRLFLAAYPTDTVQVKKGAVKNLLTVLAKERKKVINQLLSAYSSERAGLIISVLLGERAFLSEGAYEALSNAGLSHIAAVSGLHLSIWVMFIFNLLIRRNSDMQKVSLFLIGFVLIIMSFALFSGSVLRAGFMMILFLLGYALGGESDSLNSLGFSAICIFLINPYASVNAGFLLSFCSTLAMLLFALPASNCFVDYIRKRKGRCLRLASTVSLSVSVSFFVTLFTLPLQISYFGGFSGVGILSNLLMLPMLSPLLLSSGLYVMYYFIPILSNIFYALSVVALDYSFSIMTVLGKGRFYINVDRRYLPYCWIAVAVLFASLLVIIERHKRKKISELRRG